MSARLRGVLVSLLVAGILAAAVPRPAAAQQPYEFHAILPLTGGAAFLGKSVQLAMLSAERAINAADGIRGRPVRFVFHDDQSNPQVAVQLSNEVIATHPAVIFGSAISAMCNAMAPLMQNGPVMYCLSPAIHPQQGSYVFTASVSTHDYVKAFFRYFHGKGWLRLALVSTTDASGQDFDRAVAESMASPENKDIALVAHEHFSPGDVSITAQLERIRAATPQVIIGWAAGATMATVFRGLAQAGFELPVAASTSSMTYAQMAQYAAFLPKRLYYASTVWPAYGNPAVALDPSVVAQLKTYFDLARQAGWEPDTASETGWDPPRLVADALNRIGADATAGQLRDYLAHRRGFVGVDGVYDFERTPQRGLDLENTIISRWDAATKRWQPVSREGGVPIIGRD